MKVRLGFVSNSSSSSFVMIGFEAPGMEMRDAYDIAEEHDCDYMDHVENGLPKDAGGPVFGVQFRLSDDNWKTRIHEMWEVLDKVDALKKALGCESQKTKLYTGMTAT